MTSAPSKETFIDSKFLKENPDHIFVFGDNTIRQGYGGAAALRDHLNTYGFVTKIYPGNADSDFYTRENYPNVFKVELEKVQQEIFRNQDKTFLISRLGGGLADRFGIYDSIIKDEIRILEYFDNVEFLYED